MELRQLSTTWWIDGALVCQSGVLAIDLTKAFDCLNCDVILDCLRENGVGDPIFDSYLRQRKHFVRVNGLDSETQTVETGVPQGSILGPLLFIIAIHDIERSIENELHAFADDCTTWVEGTTWKEIQTSLENACTTLKSYFAFKGLKINELKCQLMVLGKEFLRETSRDVQLSINVLNKKCTESNDMKLLGVHIDNELKFNKHISVVLSKCEANLSFLWRTARDRSFDHRKLLYNALILPHLNYCDTLYHSYISQRDSQRLDSFQYRALRFICGIKRGQFVTGSPLRNQVGWQKLSVYRNAKLLSLIWKIRNGQDIPIYLKDMIEVQQFYNTRFQSRSTPFSNKYGLKLLNNIFCSQFLVLPTVVLNSPSAETFMKRYLTLTGSN